MIIIKFKENKKSRDYDGNYYIYERKSFRVEGKVKKKDVYLLAISHYHWEKEEYLSFWNKFNNVEVKRNFPEELKEDFYKAIERYSAKATIKKLEKEKILQERLSWLSDEGFITEDNYKIYEAGIEGKLWINKEEFFKDELFNSKSSPWTLTHYRYGCRTFEDWKRRNETIEEENRKYREQKQLEQDIADKRMAIDKEKASIKEEQDKIEEMPQGVERLMKKKDLCERIDQVLIMMEELGEMCK